MLRRLLPALAIALLLLPALPIGAQGANRPPIVGPIAAELAPPFTHFSVTATDPDGDALTYTWSNSNTCGRFVPAGAKADWDHGDDTDCGHDSPFHPGVIKVVVTDARGGSAVRSYYDGSSSGSGRDEPCPASNVIGEFAPSQGVWQDDELFADKPGKKLLRTDDRHYTAELDMIAGRNSALFGLRGSRDTISMRGFLSGSVTAPTVVKFTLVQGGERILYELDAGELPIEGRCGEEQGFNVPIPAATGVPAKAFQFAEGPYTIEMELFEKDGGAVPGTKVEVEGFSRSLPGIRIHVVRAVIGADDGSGRADVPRIAGELRDHATDYFPLAPGRVQTTSNAAGIDLATYLRDALARCDDESYRGNLSADACRGIVRRLRLESYFAGQAHALGADRVAVVMAAPTFRLLNGTERAQALTGHTKVLFALANSDHWDVAHEVAHTLTRYPWSDRQMASGCGQSYHNQGTFGNGVQLASGASDTRARKDNKAGLMGPVAAGKDYWIEQCEYWHLIQALQRPADPPLLALRGFVLRTGEERGHLDPGLSLDGEPDLAEEGTGAYALVLRNEANETLATYRFDLDFSVDHGGYSPGAGFAWRVPDDAAARGVALEGPAGLLAWQIIAAEAPTVSLQEAAVSGDELVVRWSSSPAGIAWILVSDDGNDFRPISGQLEEGATELRVPAADVAGAKFARVVVAEGGRAGNATGPLVGAPPAPSPTPPSTPPSTTPGAGSVDPATDAQASADTPIPVALALVGALVALALRRRSRT